MGTTAPLIVVGGHGNWELDDAGMLDVVPVCHGWKFPSNGSEAVPTLAHIPKAVRGSLGIHPFSKPSLYDHRGVSTRPAFDWPIYVSISD